MSKRNFMLFPNFKEKAVTLSYDDGVRQDKKLIEIMLKHGLKGTFNINSGFFDKEFNGQTTGRMTKEEALSLYVNSGMEVACHGYKHLPLLNLDLSVVNNEIATDRKELEKLFGKIIKGMAYSFGHYSDDIANVLKTCGIKYSRTTVSTESFSIPNDWLKAPATCHHKNPKLMDLAKEFVSIEQNPYSLQKEPLLFSLWGHSYEFDRDDNWKVIEEFAEYIGGRKDVWYATNGEIYDYVTAFDSLEYSMDGTKVYNPSGITIYYSNYGKPFEIKPLETVTVGEKGIL